MQGKGLYFYPPVYQLYLWTDYMLIQHALLPAVRKSSIGVTTLLDKEPAGSHFLRLKKCLAGKLIVTDVKLQSKIQFELEQYFDNDR